jgi:hypothetical protein
LAGRSAGFADQGAGNTRSGDGRETVMTDTGKLAILASCDRQASLESHLIAKHQHRSPCFDDKIASMQAQGMRTPCLPRARAFDSGIVWTLAVSRATVLKFVRRRCEYNEFRPHRATRKRAADFADKPVSCTEAPRSAKKK